MPVFDTMKKPWRRRAVGQHRVRAAALRADSIGLRRRMRASRPACHHRWHSRAGHDPGKSATCGAIARKTACGSSGPIAAVVVSPGKALLGIMPGHIYLQGHVGVVGRSGTLAMRPRRR